MSDQLVISSILSLVPQWFQAEAEPDGAEKYTLHIGQTDVNFFSFIRLTPALSRLKVYAEENAEKMLGFAREFPPPVAVDLIQDFLALRWLELIGNDINWKKGLGYFRELSERTYENNPVTKHLLIGLDNGDGEIIQDVHAKVIDPLATSPHVYLKVDHEFRFVNFDEVPWAQVKDTTSYKFSPEFLHPYFSALGKSEFSMHKTAKGDYVFMKGELGVVATKRHGRWKLYDPPTLKNALRRIWGDYRVACNLYEIILDLSFRRHGALLVFDPQHNAVKQVANPQSVISKKYTGTYSILADAVNKINISGWAEASPRHKRVFVELAGLDGAVIFDASRVLAFGAMIKTHDKALNQFGARTTAALSAYHWGALPTKVSADGDAICFFSSVSPTNERSLARFNFV